MTRMERILLWVGIGLMAGGVLALAIGILVVYLHYAVGL